MFRKSPQLELGFNEQGAAYLESRLAMRKFDLGLSSAPLAASFFLLEHIIVVDEVWLDVLFSLGMSCLLITALISVVQIHRFSQALGIVRSVLAQTDKHRDKLRFRPGIEGLNRLEMTLNCIGYAIIVFFLAYEVWDISL